VRKVFSFIEKGVSLKMIVLLSRDPFVHLTNPMALLLFLLLTIVYNIETIGGSFVTPSTYNHYGANYPTCNREPVNVNAPVTKGTNGFKIKLSGNPEKYVPGEMYTGIC
jgi:hypothetical protein